MDDSYNPHLLRKNINIMANITMIKLGELFNCTCIVMLFILYSASLKIVKSFFQFLKQKLNFDDMIHQCVVTQV